MEEICVERLNACTKRMDRLEDELDKSRNEIWLAVDEIRKDTKSLLARVSMIMGGIAVLQVVLQLLK